MFSTRASISGLPSRSTRRNRTPLLAGAGRIVMFTRLPLCRPVPEKLAERLSVCWLSTDGLDKTPAQLASAVDSDLIGTERGCPHPQHAKFETDAGDFKGLAVATRCGW